MSDFNEVITYSVDGASIAKFKEDFLALRVTSVNDQAGYAECHKARMEVKKKRVEVQKRRKELKQKSLEFGRAVDAKADEIVSQLEDIEAHLAAQQAIVDDEVERQKQEAVRQKAERLDWRLKQLNDVQSAGQYALSLITDMDDEIFSSLLEKARLVFEENQRRRHAERERLEQLEAERAENDKKLLEQQAETQRLQAELREKERLELESAQQREWEAEASRKEAERKLEHEKREKEHLVRENQEAEQRRADAAAAENTRVEYEAAEKAKAECAAKAAAEDAAEREIANRKMFNDIKQGFPTLPSAWVEIARLRLLLRAREV